MSLIAFLDFDGPIFTLRSHLAMHGRGGVYSDPDPVAGTAIWRMCARGRNSVKLVLTAGARFDPVSTRTALGADEPWSLYPYLHADPKVLDLHPRHAAIAHWLSQHPEVSDYRIIDDDWWPHPTQSERIVRCSSHDGLSAAAILNLYKWAGVPHPSPSPPPSV